MSKTVYIVILNYKNWTDVRECLLSILGSDYSNYKVVILDNASGDQSLRNLTDWVENKQLWLKANTSKADFYRSYNENELSNEVINSLATFNFIQNEHNNGFAAGNNVILRYLKSVDAYVWLLNPDMIVSANAMTELVQFTGSQMPRSITGAVLKKYEQPAEVYLYGGGQINWNTATISFITNLKDIGKLDYLNGSCIFLHASHFETLGLLPTEYFLYWEETDWCYNAKKLGYNINVCLTAICYDKISATIGKSYLSDFYYTRNGLLFVKKYSPGNLNQAIFSTLLRISKRLVTGKMSRANGTLAGLREFYKMQKK